jgi:arylsulfatase A-like enzyme
MNGSLNNQCVTLAETLADSGYQTYAVGKWHVGSGPEASPTARSFQEFFGFTAGYAADQ